MFIPQLTIKVQGRSELFTFFFNKWLTAYEWVMFYGKIEFMIIEKEKFVLRAQFH